MTIPSGEVGFNTYVGNNTADTFDYEFKITDEADLLVKVEDTDGVVTTYTLNTDYTVSGVGSNSGGTITLTAGNLATGYILSIEDNLESSQLISYKNQSAFFGSNHELSFDKVTRLARLAIQAYNRSVRAETTDGSVNALPNSTSRAGNLLGFDSNGDPVTTISTDSLIALLAASTISTVSGMWALFSGTPTQTSATTFTVTGDQTGVFTVGTRVKFTDSTTLYGHVTASAYTSVTTVTVVLDTGSLTGSLTEVYTSIADTTSKPIGAAALSFLHNASNAIPVSVENKLRSLCIDVVEDCGADKTGATDSIAAFNIAHASGKKIWVPSGTYRWDSVFNHTDDEVDFLCESKYGVTINVNHTGNGYNLATNNEPRVENFQLVRSTIGARGSRTGVGMRVFGDISGGSSIQAKVSHVRIRGFATGLDVYGAFLSKFTDLTVKQCDVSYKLNNNTNDSLIFDHCASNLDVGKHLVCDGGSAETGALFIASEFENANSFPVVDVQGGNNFILQFDKCYWYENNAATDTPGVFDFMKSVIAGRLSFYGSGISSAGKQDARLFYGRRNASTSKWHVTYDNTWLSTWRNTGPLIDVDALGADELVHVSPSCIYLNVGTSGTAAILHTDAEAPNALYNNKTIGITDTRLVKFPSTPVASSDPNTLDAYVEGTWTPILVDSSLSAGEGQTYSVQAGFYTRIGNKVFIQGRIVITSVGTLTAGEQARIAGLPFTSENTANKFGAMESQQSAGLNLGGAYKLSGIISPNSVNIQLNKWSATTGTTPATVAEISATGDIIFWAEYTV